MNTRVKHCGDDVTHARQDPALGLAPIFRPICRGRRPGGFSVQLEHSGASLKFNLWQALDSRDQSVLLGVIGLGGMLYASGEAHTLDAGTSHPRGQSLWGGLAPSHRAAIDDAIVIKTSRYALLKASGLHDKGQNYGLLENCLERLSMTGCRVQREGYDWSMRLLSYAETPDGQLHIALNHRFATALTGHHVHISLRERKCLDSDVAHLTHAWLSAWLRHSRTNAIRLDRLAEKIWGQPSEHESTNRSRRTKLRHALGEIDRLEGWAVTVSGRGSRAKATIKRCALTEAA